MLQTLPIYRYLYLTFFVYLFVRYISLIHITIKKIKIKYQTWRTKAIYFNRTEAAAFQVTSSAFVSAAIIVKTTQSAQIHKRMWALLLFALPYGAISLKTSISKRTFSTALLPLPSVLSIKWVIHIGCLSGLCSHLRASFPLISQFRASWLVH